MKKRIITIALSVISAVAMIGVIVYVLLMRFGGLELLVNSRIKNVIGADTHLQARLGQIEGDFLRGIVVRDIIINYDDGSRFYRMARIPRASAAYSFANLWSGRWEFSIIYIDSAEITLRQDSTGAWLLPRLASKKESANGSLSLSVSALEVKNTHVRIESRDTTREFSNVNLSAGVEVREKTLALNMRQLTFHSHMYDDENPTISAKVTVGDSLAAVTDFSLVMTQATLKGDGVAALGVRPSYHVALETATIDMNYVGKALQTNLTGKMLLSGDFRMTSNNASGNATFSGTFQERTFDAMEARFHSAGKLITIDTLYGKALQGCEIAGNAEINLQDTIPSYSFVGELARFDLSHLASGAVTSDLTGKARLSGSGLRSKDMAITIDASLRESKFDIYLLHTANGRLHVTSDSVRIEPGFTATYFENTFRGGGLVEYKGKIDLAGTANLPVISRFAGKTFISRPAGRAEATFNLSGSVKDPDLAGSLSSDSLWLYEMFTPSAVCEFKVDQFLTERVGQATGQFRGGEAWGRAFDSAEFAVTLNATRADFQSLKIYDHDTHVTSKVILNYGVYPYELTFHDLTVGFQNQSYSEVDTIEVLYDSLGFTVNQLSLSGDQGRLSVQGRANFDESFNLTVEADGIEILPWTALIPEGVLAHGILSGTGSLRGSLDNPEFTIDAHIDSLRYRDFVFGDLATRLDYHDSLLRIDTLTLLTNPGMVEARGVIPLAFKLRQGIKPAFPAEQKVSVAFDVARFDIISYFLSDVESLDGRFTGQLALSGYPDRPHFDGSASFRDGTLKAYELENPAESLTVDFTLKDRLVTVTNGACLFRPITKKKNLPENEIGRATVTGSMVVLAVDSISYNLALTGKNIPINYTLGAFTGRADASLRVTGVRPPRVRGTIDLISGLYEEEFVPEDAGYSLLSQFERPEAWDIDVDINILSNCAVRNSEIEANFSGQTANARRIRGLWQYVYEIEVVRGKVYVPPIYFRLDPGGTVVNQDYAKNDPTLNLIARTRVRVPDIDPGATDGKKTREVTASIQITGTLAKPTISYYDDPNVAESDKIAEDQLYSILALGAQVKGGGSAGFGEQLAERTAAILSAPLTRLGARSIGVETFEIDPNADIARSQVYFGHTFLPNLYGYGNFGLSGQEVGFEAMLTRGVTLQGRLNEDKLYSMFFHFGWDY